MRVVKSFAGISAFCISLLLASCGSGSDPIDSCGGNNELKQEHFVNNYTATLVRYAKTIDLNSSGEIPTALANNETLPWNTFSLELKAAYQTYSVQASPVLRVSLFEQALACTPAPPRAKQKLTKISITSANDYNAAHPAGSELLPLFGSINNAVTNLTGLLVNWPAPLELKLKLLEAPQNSRQNFEVQITLDDGSVYIVNTGDVYFTIP